MRRGGSRLLSVGPPVVRACFPFASHWSLEGSLRFPPASSRSLVASRWSSLLSVGPSWMRVGAAVASRWFPSASRWFLVDSRLVPFRFPVVPSGPASLPVCVPSVPRCFALALLAFRWSFVGARWCRCCFPLDRVCFPLVPRWFALSSLSLPTGLSRARVGSRLLPVGPPLPRVGSSLARTSSLFLPRVGPSSVRVSSLWLPAGPSPSPFPWQKSMPKGPPKVTFFVPKPTSTPKGRLMLPCLPIFEDARNHRFFDASPVGQQIRKIGPYGNIKPIQGKRLELQLSIFGNQGPREPRFSRAQANRKRAKGKKETRNKPEKGSNTPIGRWLGEFGTTNYRRI